MTYFVFVAYPTKESCEENVSDGTVDKEPKVGELFMKGFVYDDVVLITDMSAEDKDLFGNGPCYDVSVRVATEEELKTLN